MSKLRILGLFLLIVVCKVKGRTLIEASYTREQSGASEGIEECSTMFVEYPNFYLRGVTENSYSIWYQNTTFDACKSLCCFAEDDCLSFSYLANLDICFIMNITRRHEGVELRKANGWKHFQKFHTLETTTVYVEEETTQSYRPPNDDESDPLKEGSRSLPNIIPSVTTPLPSTDPIEEVTTEISSPPLARGANLAATNTVEDKIAKENIIKKPETTQADPTSDITTSSTTQVRSETTIASNPPQPTISTTPHPSTITAPNSATSTPSQPTPTSIQHAGVANFTEDSATEKSQSSFIIDSSNRDDLLLNDPTYPQNSSLHVATSQNEPEAPEKIIARPDDEFKSNNILGTEGSGFENEEPGKENPMPTLCPMKCENGGRCEVILVDAVNALTAYRCLCMDHFVGANCEQHMAKSTGGNRPADYAIALICLAIIIVILFVTVLIAFYLNRHKTGKYRVRKEKERWNRRRKKRGAQSFVNSPTGSLAASEGSVRSGSDRSTATLV